MSSNLERLRARRAEAATDFMWLYCTPDNGSEVRARLIARARLAMNAADEAFFTYVRTQETTMLYLVSTDNTLIADMESTASGAFCMPIASPGGKFTCERCASPLIAKRGSAVAPGRWVAHCVDCNEILGEIRNEIASSNE